MAKAAKSGYDKAKDVTLAVAGEFPLANDIINGKPVSRSVMWTVVQYDRGEVKLNETFAKNGTPGQAIKRMPVSLLADPKFVQARRDAEKAAVDCMKAQKEKAA